MDIHPGATFSSPVDTRDVLIQKTNIGVIPDEVDIDTSMLNYVYQRKIGACTACSIIKICEYLWWKKTGVYQEFSVRFTYNIIKKYIDLNLTEGSCLRSGLKAVQKYGLMLEKDCPTDFNMTHSDFLGLNITSDMLAKASKWHMGAYYSIPVDKSLIHYALWRFGPLYARVETSDQWWTGTDGVVSWAEDKILPIRQGITASGHGVGIIKSISPTYVEWFINSWSKLWGHNGDGYYNWDTYKPTEVWAITFDTIPTATVDNSPMVSDSTWRKFMDYLREWKVIK